ncbi:host specificity protein J [Erwinia sp. AnSW2-5]|uniref:host specificity protein J n=1 Tax=Erwinia sp. AnSW2-5 TaxID=3367692 RepID=UPI00385A11DD
MGSGGGGGSTPTLINDNLTSKQFYKVLDIISDGPIYGPVDQRHLSSFRVNKTPVTSASGTVNIPGVSVAWRPGSADQSPINGFAAIEATVIINTDVTQATPLVRTVTDSDVTRVRFNLGVNALVQQDTKGNQQNTSITMVIETRTGNNAFQIAQTVTIRGKISGEYLEAHVINAPETKPFDIRVRRITPDSTSDLLNNGTVWNSYTEITDDNLSYPFTAVCGAVIDRDQYTDTPNRTYHLRGVIVDVPDNYNPLTRTYAGIWTGGFKSAWTNNPAWIFRALVKNTRYGLARRAGYIDVDDGSLYVLSQFCDQEVDDGYGGKEPRFTLNAYITEQKSARELLDDIAGMFRGIALWDGMRFSIMIDRPQDPVAAVTNASVVDGLFTYSSMKRSERFNAVVVSWTDPNNGWEQVKEYYSDDKMISDSGSYNETTVEAFGCTSRGQALRTAKWLVESAKLEAKKVTFKMARDAIAFLPGDIIEVMDNKHAATRLGGRIIAHAGAVITVDADVSDIVGSGDKMSIMGANGKFEKYEIVSVSGAIITLKSAPAWVKDGTVFVISTGEVSTRLWRIMAVSEDDNNSVYSISATLHDPNKQAIVDEGAVFETPSDTLNGYRVPNIENLKIINTNSETVQVTATWETATTTKKLMFELYVYTTEGALVAQYETDQFRYEFYGLDAGDYTLGVRGRNENGMKGAETQVSLVIGAPSAPTYVQWIPGLFSAVIVPVMSVTATTDTSYEFWWAGETPVTGIDDVEDTTQFLGRGTQWSVQGLKADTTYYMYVRTKNAFGVSPFVEVSGEASADIPGMIDLIDEAIRDSETFDRLDGKIDTSINGLLELASAVNASVDHQWKQYGTVRADIIIVKTTIADVDKAMAELSTQVQAQFDDVTASVNEKLTATVKSDGTASAFYDVGLQILRDGVYYKSGMSMGIEPDGSSYKSTIAFNADQLGIYTGNEANGYQLVFATINGQAFLDTVFIKDGSIDNLKIGQYIQSNDWDNAAQKGWQLNKSGKFTNYGSVAGEGKMKQDNNTISVQSATGQLIQIGRLTGVF